MSKYYFICWRDKSNHCILTFIVHDLFHDLTNSAARRSCQVMKLWNGFPVFLHLRTENRSNHTRLSLHSHTKMHTFTNLSQVMKVALWVEIPSPSIWHICKPESKPLRWVSHTFVYGKYSTKVFLKQRMPVLIGIKYRPFCFVCCLRKDLYYRCGN